MKTQIKIKSIFATIIIATLTSSFVNAANISVDFLRDSKTTNFQNTPNDTIKKKQIEEDYQEIFSSVYTQINEVIENLELEKMNMNIQKQIKPIIDNTIIEVNDLIKIEKGDSNKTKYCYSDGITNYNMTYKGTIVFNDSETDILSISPGGYLKYSKASFGVKRGVIIESKSNGELIKEYYVGNKLQAWEPEGKEWFTNSLPEIIRNTGINAEARTKRIYSQKGINGILEEINLMESNHAKSEYFDALIPIIKESEKKIIIENIGKNIKSNFEKSQILSENAKLFMTSDENTLAYFTCVSGITSNFEKSNILEEILEENNLTDYQMGALLLSAGTISSNFEKSNVLNAIKKINFENNLILKAYFEVVNSISSNFERSNVLTELINDKTPNSETWIYIFKSVAKMSSNFEKSNVLTTSIQKLPINNNEIMNEFFDATATVSSNFEKSNILSNLTQNRKDLPKSVILKLIEHASSIKSDFEKSNVLNNIIKVAPKDDAEIKEALKKATNTINSSFYKSTIGEN